MVRSFSYILLGTVMTLAMAAGKRVEEQPIVLPEKYGAEHYANLKPYEQERCARYVQELTLMEKRKRLGLHPGEAEKMQARSVQIDKEYDHFCLKIFDAPTATNSGPALGTAK